MNLFNSIKNSFSRNKGANYVGAPSFSNRNPGYGFLDSCLTDDFSIAYPSIRAISNEFFQIRPYAIDSNGKRIDNSPVVNALYHPNKTDSSVMFFEKLAVSTLVHKNTYLLVWRREGSKAYPGGKINANNIAGFTFLEFPSIQTREDGKYYYTVNNKTYSEDEVITIPGGVDAYDLYTGYSPTIASRRYANLDDCITDFQKGYFDNGAVPAGQFIITATSKQDYEDTVSKLEAAHRGAGKNNNITYTPRPVDGATGKPGSAKIEWIPFSEPNKNIDFATLFSQVNKRIDLAYGVPQIVKGVDDAATYANAQVAESGFAKRAVKPQALKIYTTITHELNRITGGLGVAIAFDYEIPAIADDEYVKAQTKNIEADIIIKLTQAGYNLDSVVEAAKFGNNWKNLDVYDKQTNIINDKPDVDEGGEVNSSPDPKTITNNLKCSHDHGGSESSNPKAQADEEKQLKQIAMNLLEKQVAKAISEFNDENPDNAISGDVDDKDIQKFTDEMYSTISTIISKHGIDQTSEIKKLLEDIGLPTELITDFNISDNLVESYKTYLRNVGLSYSDDTRKFILKTLENAYAQNLTAHEIRNELNKIPELNGWRAERIARTETVRAEGNGKLAAVEKIQDQTGIEFNKTWNSRLDKNTCQYCRNLHDTTIPLKQAFIFDGETIEGENGGTRLNNFEDIKIASGHPNCRCWLTFSVSSTPSTEAPDNKAIFDADTGRYLGYRLNNGYIALKGFKSKKDTIVKTS